MDDAGVCSALRVEPTAVDAVDAVDVGVALTLLMRLTDSRSLREQEEGA
jgi:hypothetical protein